ncbi:unnamed protein product [Vitrella brassicaformis CCMP3155]|uniref:Uncharacterized protein n=1 Tax=Vitrella brassicaformis (strain CCMP3155) TaxID=1169540 RepID=A0A0G4F1H8_VITBC|nr:unnamed protein product [Vitrella brassicaformis CCMP3155]|eukprot:CEM05245.1 unnamed protein product [Vitrella brassicaformis CCMP3155]
MCLHRYYDGRCWLGCPNKEEMTLIRQAGPGKEPIEYILTDFQCTAHLTTNPCNPLTNPFKDSKCALRSFKIHSDEAGLKPHTVTFTQGEVMHKKFGSSVGWTHTHSRVLLDKCVDMTARVKGPKYNFDPFKLQPLTMAYYDYPEGHDGKDLNRTGEWKKTPDFPDYTCESKVE